MAGEAPEAVLFDIDGTLVDTGGAGARSWALAFERLYGHAVDIGVLTDAGMTDPVVARRTFERDQGREPGARELARLVHAYLSVLPDFVERSEGYRVLDGVDELLPRLAGAGVLLGLTTGAIEAAAHAKLGRAGLNRWFAFGGYGSDSSDRVELTRRALLRGERVAHHRLDPRRVLVVGDTPLDVAAAHGAGLVAVGVASHHHTREQLAEAGADHVLGSLAEPFPGLV
ncbi:MAG: HAD family hydrolase [Thermoleophilaceae bacterium]|nr:HAD family hydrolase [Thermoleophilaceae bacterium]